MAVTSSGQLKLKDDILDEKQNASTAQSNVSLRGHVLDGVNDYRIVDIATNTNSGANPPQTGNTSDHQMSEFYGYDHDAAGTTFSSMYSSFSQAILTTTAAAYSLVRTFVVNNGSGALTISIGSIAPNSGTLSVAASSVGDPGTSGTANSGTGFVAESSTLSHTPTSWGSSKTIYLRFKVTPAPSANSDASTVTISNNGVSTSGGNVTIVTNSPKSDIRFKTNIDRIGYSDMNIPIYLFNYKDDLNTTY